MRLITKSISPVGTGRKEPREKKIRKSGAKFEKLFVSYNFVLSSSDSGLMYFHINVSIIHD